MTRASKAKAIRDRKRAVIARELEYVMCVWDYVFAGCPTMRDDVNRALSNAYRAGVRDERRRKKG